jgi:predicted RNase H-like HicB family nuclease
MKNLQYYLALPYTVIMRRDEDGDYVARIDELPGCAAHGESPEQAFTALEEAKHLWITDCLENGAPVPEPSTEEEALPSGKWVQRAPKTLHKELVSLAKREHVSLNQLVTSLLAEAVGMRKVGQPEHRHWMDGRLRARAFISGSGNLFRCCRLAKCDITLTGAGWQRVNWPEPAVLTPLRTDMTTGTISDRLDILIQPHSEEVTAHG